jgi:alkanesulfonate monooxygenase SsuD/methylene tetrahydromethanopterin reductase-like flavin-dependent oxidoreductase (luciferase family)
MPALPVGVILPSMSDRPDEPVGDMAATARHAEDLGFESVWVVDQLIAGTGVPVLDSVVALTTAAAATTRVRLGFGVMIVPLRSVTWAAKEVASLQHVSGDRVILGVGVGGDRHDRSWAAAGVPRRERGRRLDAALRVLPDLIAGKDVRLGDGTTGPDAHDAPIVRLAPAATVPPIVVGGNSEAAMARAVDYGDGWYPLPGPPGALAAGVARLGELAESKGRPRPEVSASVLVAMADDPAVPDHDGLVRLLTDPDGRFGMPADLVAQMLVTGGTAEVADRLSEHVASGAERLVVSVAAGEWRRQAELLAEATSRIA